VRAGCHQNQDSPIRRRYKDSKATFRALLCNHKRKLNEMLHGIDIDASNPRKLFSHLRRAKGKSSDPTTTLQVNGVTYSGKELPSSWARYFGSLATPTDTAYEFKQSIESKYCELLNQPLDSFTPFIEKWRRLNSPLMGRQIILKWSYLIIFMRVLVAVSVRWCKV